MEPLYARRKYYYNSEFKVLFQDTDSIFPKNLTWQHHRESVNQITTIGYKIDVPAKTLVCNWRSYGKPIPKRIFLAWEKDQHGYTPILMYLDGKQTSLQNVVLLRIRKFLEVSSLHYQSPVHILVKDQTILSLLKKAEDSSLIRNVVIQDILNVIHRNRGIAIQLTSTHILPPIPHHFSAPVGWYVYL